jgi:hypothetical protein
VSFLAFLRHGLSLLWDVLRPVPRVVEVTTIEKTSSTSNLDEAERARWDRLCAEVARLCEDFRRATPGTNVRVDHRLHFSSDAVAPLGLDAGACTCPWCGKINRVRGGRPGATCGSCHHPLEVRLN